MSAFLFLAALLIGACLYLLLRPLLRGAPASPEGDELLAVLRQQREELDAERAAGKLDDAEYQRGLDELATRLTSETHGTVARAPRAGQSRAWAAAVAVTLPLAAAGFYLLIGNPAGLDPARTAPASVEDMQRDQIDTALAALETRVKNDPEDIDATKLLARSYLALGRHADAERVYGGLAKRLPGDAQVLVDFADAMASARGRDLAGEPAQLVERALQLAPDNFKALALGGAAAYQRGDFKTSVARFERLLAQLPPDNELSDAIRSRLDEARAQAGMPPSQRPAAAAEGVAGGELKLQGRIVLAEPLRARAAPQDPVFVFVRPADGGPPLAAIRATVAELPLDFDFTGVQRMNPGPLPKRVIVGARIAKSGQPRAMPGDLEGLSQPVAVDARQMQIAIDRVVPER